MDTVSIAIETSCRAGGLALGCGEAVTATIEFDASARHATHLVTQLKELLDKAGLSPADLSELYISAGPGSFTGLRVGITVARTMAQALPRVRCVAVPTPQAVAENARCLSWEHLAVVLDAREGQVHASLFERNGQQIVSSSVPPRLYRPEEFLSAAPRPLLLIGEGLGYHEPFASALRPAGPGAERAPLPPEVTLAPAELNLPGARGVWAVGRRMAAAGQFVPWAQLLPVYVRNPFGT
ncbi:MAG: tRNA (adenosine(37)-N6)-threonylcarbamoyltransferase complex dimerization subunit type 1 TsaB [Phycisphaerae bacterium]|jgi:tRNA threonylcarbamoyladenosine biosynthesis protein TsaB